MFVRRARILAALASGGVLAVAVLDGCGSRGPLDDTPFFAADATTEAAEAALEPDVVAEAAPALDARPESGGPLACGACVFTTCGQAILGCFQSAGCRTVFQCVTQSCLGGAAGGLNPICLFQCAGGDPSGALDVLSVFQCVTGQCGPDCGEVLGALGGLGGGGGGGGRDAGSRDAGIRDAAVRD